MSAPPITQVMISLANLLADTSGLIIRRYFRTHIVVDTKADTSPVTIADRETESVLRDILHHRMPTHGVIGEEYGAENVTAEWVWILDPIDGTKAFITGKPSFGTLIGLAWQGKPMLGVIDQPITKERWIGGHGIPAKLNNQPIQVRQCATLAHASLYATDPDMFHTSINTYSTWKYLERKVRLRRFGADCYAYGLLATGLVDLVYECQLKVYDYLPVAAVVEAAGGIITDRYGHVPTIMESEVCIVASGDGRVHEQVLSILNFKKKSL